jgi:hypothetical protein
MKPGDPKTGQQITFKIVFLDKEYKTVKERQERRRQLEQQAIADGACTQEELDNGHLMLKDVARAMFPLIAPALVKQYLREMEVEKLRKKLEEPPAPEKKRRTRPPTKK